jgi:hypothetical protein
MTIVSGTKLNTLNTSSTRRSIRSSTAALPWRAAEWQHVDQATDGPYDVVVQEFGDPGGVTHRVGRVERLHHLAIPPTRQLTMVVLTLP